jgi:hypothetical protein
LYLHLKYCNRNNKNQNHHSLNPKSVIHAESSLHELNKHVLRQKLSLKDTYTQSNHRAGYNDRLPHLIVASFVCTAPVAVRSSASATQSMKIR